MIDTVVIATDGSESVRRAVDVALDLAGRFDATVHALYVVDTTEVDASPDELREDLAAALERSGEDALADVTGRHETRRASERASGRSPRADREVITAVREGDPAGKITDYAREHDADVVATGTRGRHGEHRFLLGSVAERVVRTCPVPVLTVRQLGGEAVV
jgi:nucleotide-binding universal stress UspA family protein